MFDTKWTTTQKSIVLSKPNIKWPNWKMSSRWISLPLHKKSSTRPSALTIAQQNESPKDQPVMHSVSLQTKKHPPLNLEQKLEIAIHHITHHIHRLHTIKHVVCLVSRAWTWKLHDVCVAVIRAPSWNFVCSKKIYMSLCIIHIHAGPSRVYSRLLWRYARLKNR